MSGAVFTVYGDGEVWLIHCLPLPVNVVTGNCSWSYSDLLHFNVSLDKGQVFVGLRGYLYEDVGYVCVYILLIPIIYRTYDWQYYVCNVVGKYASACHAISL